MMRARKSVYSKEIDSDVDCEIDHCIFQNDAMARIPDECQEFFQNNEQMVCSDERIRFMKLTALREAVIANKADDWSVIDFDFETDVATFVCVYCVTDLEHPKGDHPSVRSL